MSAEFQIQHYDVFRRQGAFAGWPANYGLWSWGAEILSVFAVGKMGPKGEIHELDRDHAFAPWQARSLDGGISWATEPFLGHLPGGASLSADEHLEPELKIRRRLDPVRDLAALHDPIDFLDPETIVMCARTGLSQTSVSWFYVSRSRGRDWAGPFSFNGLDMPIAARTDIVPLGRLEALFMMTTAKSDGQEGRVFCARTRDGGLSFEFIGFIGDEPPGYRIMPSSLRLPDGSIVTATRCADEDGRGWIEVFVSTNAGMSWSGPRVVGSTGTDGNPPALARLDDGRTALVYGYRDYPFGLKLRLSTDGGRSWKAGAILRADGGTSDIGYPKAVPLGGGSLLVVYYFNDGEGLERYIAASRVTLRGCFYETSAP